MVTRFWILLSAWAVSAGWVLSATHELNPAGYLVMLAIGAAGFLWWWRKEAGRWFKNWEPLSHRLCRRCRRPAPLAFLLLVSLALADGIFYPPMGMDESQYRTPRVLHWLAQDGWHWIRTFDIRMNILNCGFEWLTAPLLLFTHTDRFIFLINVFSFALLPGLVFSVFRRLHVRGRVAWWWMWLVAGGWCFAIPAGMAGNDMFAAVYALAAVDLALRARERGNVSDLWLSLLAVGLLTGAKQVDVPLALLWLIAAVPSLALLRMRPAASLAVLLAGLLVSAAPTMCLNAGHDCTWLGTPKHPGPDWTAMPWPRLQLQSPVWGMLGNAFCLPVQNLAPPIFPFYEAWNSAMEHFLGTPLGAHFRQFEGFGHLTAYPARDSGLGLFLWTLLALSCFVAWRRKSLATKNAALAPDGHWTIPVLRWVPWLMLLALMAKMGTINSARHLAAYYPFLLPSLLAAGGHSWLSRRKWWQIASVATMLATATFVILSPLLPLWPAATVLDALERRHPDSHVLLRLRSFYSTPEILRAVRHPFVQSLPPDERVVGYATDAQGLEPGLWRPFTRRVERVLPGDTPEELSQRGIRYVVVDDFFCRLGDGNLDHLLTRYQGRLADTMSVPLGLGRPPAHYYLIQLAPTPR
jgi:hypothetical protein